MRQFCLGERKGVLRTLISKYKYESTRAVAAVLAELLASNLRGSAVEWSRPMVVALPTVAKHVRERGFDHMALMARLLCRECGFEAASWLVRAANTVQVGASSELRRKQARQAYALRCSGLDPVRDYLLLDDVWTTGSSMSAAAEKIFRAGARKIDFVVVAKSVT